MPILHLVQPLGRAAPPHPASDKPAGLPDHRGYNIAALREITKTSPLAMLTSPVVQSPRECPPSP